MIKGELHSVMANVLYTDIVVSEFELWSRYYIHFWISALEKGMKSLIPPAIVYIVLLLFFSKDIFGIK